MPQFSAADPIVILSYARTPMGGMQGALADVSATELGATAVKAAVERSGVSPEDIERLMALTSPDVGLLFDSGHCFLGGGEPLEVLRQHIGRICHVHFKDVRKGVVQLARNNLWSFPDCIVNGAFTVPGDGDIDFAPLLRELLHGHAQDAAGSPAPAA